MRGRGYTLLEILIVIAVLAILLGMGFTTYLKARRRAQVRDALTTLVTTLREARSAAQRFNVNVQVRFPSNREYQLEVVTPGSAPVRSYKRVIPPYLELDYSHDAITWKKPAGFRIRYYAPFGETRVMPALFRVRHKQDPGLSACLRIISVTGKVVIARACP